MEFAAAPESTKNLVVVADPVVDVPTRTLPALVTLKRTDTAPFIEVEDTVNTFALGAVDDALLTTNVELEIEEVPTPTLPPLLMRK
jgi:hypothetical protein